MPDVSIAIGGTAMEFTVGWASGKPVVLSGKYSDNGRILGTKSLQFYAAKFNDKITKGIRMEIEKLAQTGASLKAQITELSEELKAIDIELASKAEFKNGSKTGHLVAGGIKITVTTRDNVKWDQSKLNQVKEFLPDVFNQAFIPEYKPASAKALDAAIKQDENFAKAVEWSREVSPGKPTVKYEVIQDDDIPF